MDGPAATELACARRRLPGVPTRQPHRRLRQLLLAFAATTMLAGGCSAQAGQLTDREFLSVNVTERGAARPLVAGTRVRLHFSASELGASAGCNSIGGSYRVEGGRLVFEGGSMTEMGCDEPRHAQDEWLVEFLASKPTVRLAGTDLTLEGGTTVLALRDRTVVEPDQNLVGPTWTVESLINGDAFSSVPGGAVATLVFAADGTVQVATGCNRGSARWSATGPGIQVSDLVLTKMACQGAGAALESEVVAVLDQGSLVAEIKANQLTLVSGTRGLGLRAS